MKVEFFIWEFHNGVVLVCKEIFACTLKISFAFKLGIQPEPKIKTIILMDSENLRI